MSFFCQLLFQASFCWVVLSHRAEFQLQQSHLLISEGGDKIVHCQLKWLHHSKIPSIQNNLLTKLIMGIQNTQNISEALFLICFSAVFTLVSIAFQLSFIFPWTMQQKCQTCKRCIISMNDIYKQRSSFLFCFKT